MHFRTPSPMGKMETLLTRILFALMWIGAISGATWVFWSESHEISIALPILINLLSIPIGYFVGYKWRWAPNGAHIELIE